MSTTPLRRRGFKISDTETNKEEVAVKQILNSDETPADTSTPVATETVTTPSPASSNRTAIFANKGKEVELPTDGFLRQDVKVDLFRQKLIDSHANFAGITRADAERVLNLAESFLVENSAKYTFNVAGNKMKRRTIGDRWYVTTLGGDLVTFVPAHEESILRVSHRNQEDTVRGVIQEDGSVVFGEYDANGQFVADDALTAKYLPLFEAHYGEMEEETE